MSSLITYQFDGTIATLSMDDGKANVISPAMLAELNAALDRAEQDRAVVLLAGRPGVFSGGFDLGVLTTGGRTAVELLLGGFELASRLLAFPRPVVVACTGHAVAMGAFLLLAADYRVGADGFTCVANEVAIGLTIPRAAVELLRQRLTPADFNRALLLADVYSGDEARRAGFLDLLAAPGQVEPVARAAALRFADLHDEAHEQSKWRARATTLTALRQAIDDDARELWARLGGAPG